jgi:hypothetical protein
VDIAVVIPNADHPVGTIPDDGIGLAQGDEKYQLIFPEGVDGRLICVDALLQIVWSVAVA